MTRGWPDPSLSLTCMGQIAKWLRFLNSTCKSDYKSCAACPKKSFIFVTFRDLSWPNVEPDPYLVWQWCSQCDFTSPLWLLWLSFKQKLSILLALGFIIQKRQNLTFGLTLTRELRSVLNLKYALGRSCGEHPNDAFRGSIRPLVFEIAGVGSDPPGGRGYENAQTVPG